MEGVFWKGLRRLFSIFNFDLVFHCVIKPNPAETAAQTRERAREARQSYQTIKSWTWAMT